MPEEKNEVMEENVAVTDVSDAENSNVTVVEEAVENEIAEETQIAEELEENPASTTTEMTETPCDDMVGPQVKKISKFERQKQIKKTAKLAFSILCWTACAFVLILCISNLYQQIFNPDGYTGLFGFGEAVVASDSMDAVGSNPRIQKNDLVFYKEANIAEIKAGDIVIYESNTSAGTKLIIHRVIEINENTFIAKGDNNAVADDPMPTTAIVGQYAFKLNDIGVIFNLLSAKFAPLLIIFIIVLVFAARVAYYFFNKKRMIQKISTNETNRAALNHFFDI